MTIKEVAQKYAGSMNIEVVQNGEVILVFGCEYWKYIVDSILDLEVGDYTIRTQILGKSTVVITLPDGTATPGGDDDDTEAITDEEIDEICK